MILRAITALAVVACIFGYWHTLQQRSQLEEHLTQSRRKLQDKLESLQRIQRENDQFKLSEQALKDQVAELQARADGFQNRFEMALDELEKLRDDSTMQDLKDEVESLRTQLYQARSRSSSPEPYLQEIAQLRDELTQLKNNTPQGLSDPGSPTPSPAHASQGIKESSSLPARSPGHSLGEVIRVGPDGSFVIVNYGTVRGARSNRVLDAFRDGTRVGRMRLTQVTNDFSVAQVLPDSNLNPEESDPDIRAGDILYEAQSI